MYKLFFKRGLDFIFSLLLLPFVGLLIILVAPIIYFNDPGPVFFKAKRRGKDGTVFSMYKFRSMYIDAPDLRNEDGSTYNSHDDYRVTRVGKILRKTSMDEIPQLINVFKGDMSFIGPRPAMVSMDYSQLDETRRKRLEVRPGITGYSQAYYRNSINQKEKYELDCEYVDNISFILDLKIIIKTVKSVITKSNVFIK